MPTPVRLLLVEDAERDAALLVRLLRRGGYDVAFERVDSAGALATALDAAAWDLVIADFSIPGFSTPAALRLVRERGMDLPFIIVSGTISRDTAVQMMQEGAQDFLDKDDLARLLPAIARELRAAAERRARRAAEEALRSSEERFRLLFAANPQPMWVYDLQSLAILEVNEAAIAQYGYTREEFLRMRITDILPPEAVPRLLEPIQERRAGLAPASIWQHRRKDGGVIESTIAARTLQIAERTAGLIVAGDVTGHRQGQAPGQAHEPLSPREQEVLKLLVQGVTSNRELAARLVVSENTVRYHMRNILAKLRLRNRTQVVAYALRHGLVEPPGAS